VLCLLSTLLFYCVCISVYLYFIVVVVFKSCNSNRTFGQFWQIVVIYAFLCITLINRQKGENRVTVMQPNAT
jgi:hypothetical protein